MDTSSDLKKLRTIFMFYVFGSPHFVIRQQLLRNTGVPIAQQVEHYSKGAKVMGLDPSEQPNCNPSLHKQSC